MCSLGGATKEWVPTGRIARGIREMLTMQRDASSGRQLFSTRGMSDTMLVVRPELRPREYT